MTKGKACINKFFMKETKIGNYRWTIASLLFFAMTVNYLDRQVISLLKPILSKVPVVDLAHRE